MLSRSFPVVLVTAVLALLMSQPALAEDKAHEGKVVKVADGKLTMTFKGDKKEHTHDVAKNAKITLDGKKAKLEELKKDFHVKVTMDDKHVLTKIEAHSKKK